MRSRYGAARSAFAEAPAGALAEAGARLIPGNQRCSDDIRAELSEIEQNLVDRRASYHERTERSCCSHASHAPGSESFLN